MLPFIKDSSQNLHNNEHVANKIAQNWNKLAKKPKERKKINSFMKLYSRQYIQKVDDLSDNKKDQMDASLIPSGGYIIPWQVVTKASSLSMLVRLVMNAASRTPNGTSLNDILAKGNNAVASLFSTLVNFRLGGAALSADIVKFYNQTRLDPSFLQFQQIRWPEDWLAEGGEGGREGGELKSVKMLSGRQCAVGIGELTKYAEEQRPELAASVEKNRRRSFPPMGRWLACWGMFGALSAICFLLSQRSWTLFVQRESKLTLVHLLIFSLRIPRCSQNEIFSLCLSAYSTHLVCTAQFMDP